jgi:hypothetical protein
MECMRNTPILPLANFEDFWSNVFRHATIEPRCVPKRSFATIAKRDGCSGVKDLHVDWKVGVLAAAMGLVG